MAMQEFISLTKFRVLFSCVLSFASLGSFAFEVSPYGSGSSRESDLQMQQAQEAIRSICSCVVGGSPGMNANPMMSANCGPITSASLQPNPYGNPMGMQGMGANGQMPMMNGQPQLMMPGMNHNGMQQMNPMMNGQPQMMPAQPGMIPSR